MANTLAYVELPMETPPMKPNSPRVHGFSLLLLVACFLSLSNASLLLADDEPIAYVGHGALFDAKGNEIVPTPEFVAKAQNWYREHLVAQLTPEKKAAFRTFEKRFQEAFQVQGQTQLVVQQRVLEWLAANSAEMKDGGRTMSKLNALKFQLQWKLPPARGKELMEKRELFNLEPEIENKLKLPEFASGGIHVLTATTNTGQAYINECAAAGVPIPPTIGKIDPAGLNGWRTQGFIPATAQFIVRTPAEVRTYHSSSPEGLCIALPRYSDSTKTTVALDGVICLGQVSSKVCFWDNQMRGVGFPFPAVIQVPIGAPDTTINGAGQYQAGGFELNGGSGGVCTDCHAGENPYVIHPQVDLGGGLLMGQLNHPPLNLPTFSVNRYDPLVAAGWPQNALSQSPTLVPAVCSGCHTHGGIGGRFPHLSSDLPGYCGTILAQAITKTMPPGAPGSQAGNPEVVNLQNWCRTPPSAGPSDRGDPHLTTTNGVNYDFQAAGEFVSIRNSDTRFEVQTRQTAISTTFVPGVNPYTGLGGCVSINTAVAVRVGKHRITYQPGKGETVSKDRMQLRIDGRAVNLPSGGLNLGGGNYIATAAGGSGLNMTLSDSSHLLITPYYWADQGYWYLDVEAVNSTAREGTMGTILGSDWLPLAPDGSSFGQKPVSLADRYVLLNQKFADAWRVTKTTSLFDYAPGTSTDTFTDRAWPAEKSSVCLAPGSTGKPAQTVKLEVAQRLCRVIKDHAAYEDCVFDMVAMGDESVLKAYERTLKLRQDAIAAAKAAVLE
jgi:hypothetical protein